MANNNETPFSKKSFFKVNKINPRKIAATRKKDKQYFSISEYPYENSATLVKYIWDGPKTNRVKPKKTVTAKLEKIFFFTVRFMNKP